MIPRGPAVNMAPTTIRNWKPDTACHSMGAIVRELTPWGTTRAMLPWRETVRHPSAAKYCGVPGVYAAIGALGARLTQTRSTAVPPAARARQLPARTARSTNTDKRAEAKISEKVEASGKDVVRHRDQR